MARLPDGIVLGSEREIDRRRAGLRTRKLTGMAAALYCLVTVEMIPADTFSGDSGNTDRVRVIEAVTRGLAFLVAG